MLRTACIALFVLAAAASARAAPPSFRIVQSVPERTTLAAPGVARTAEVWQDMLGGARQRIDIAAFYISDQEGEPLSPILDTLVARARAGVQVRLLLDKTFMKQSESSLGRLRHVPNLEIRSLPVGELAGGVLHAKFMVVDTRSVFVGSQNLDWRSLSQIHEIGARIDDARFARTYEAVFASQWRLAAQPSLPAAERRAVEAPGFAPAGVDAPVLLHGTDGEPLTAFAAFSPPALMPRWVTREQDALVRMIGHARHDLRIQVMTLDALPEFGPKQYWRALDGALRDAAVRGVKVRIIVADWALRQPMQAYLSSLAALPGIEVRFSTLPPAPRGFIPYARVEHCKYAVADDDQVYIGTGNWGWSYFNASVDASVFVHGKGPAATLAGIFERDWDGGYVTPLRPGHEYPAPRTH